MKINGKNAVKEYKTTNGYFTHTIIFKNGWFISIGGADIVNVNKRLTKLGSDMATKKVTEDLLNESYKTLKKLGIGHFVLKSPNGEVKAASYYSGYFKKFNFKLKSGEYAVIPNSPRSFKKGKNPSKIPEKSVISILAKDKYGVNRRNIMVYSVSNINKKTKIQIWATNDNGKYVGLSTSGLKDNVYFGSKKISKTLIPAISKKKYIGSVTLA
ncbi:hypothetical protein [Methanobrevibacter filiformis]|uniref:Uncharacterized protein n=1 Tax=Methanobrevibacter filiformis TaxID=55758 RepID=A0A166CJ52_9EURY|nr:hypothetical protein [Methanobrevibacter filiformis]KZX14566.1 hypothetical protein MBFIL_08450 [Methanobrevibacter filiformis]